MIAVILNTAAVLVSQAEAIVRSLTNMAAADSNSYLKSNYMLNINNRQTKHYTYSYIRAVFCRNVTQQKRYQIG